MRLTLGPRALDDLEMLSSGAFAPLSVFMGRADYEACLATMRRATGLLFRLPVTLPAETSIEAGSASWRRLPQ